MRKVLHYSLVLTVIGVVTALGIGFSYQAMKDRIAQKQLEVTLLALDEVLPGNARRPWTTVDGRPASDPDAVFAGYDGEGRLIGYAALAEHQGYSSKVRVVVGVEPDVRDTDAIVIKAVSVVAQQETPGLGARVEERKSSRSIWDVVTFSGKPETFTNEFLDQFQKKTYNRLRIAKDRSSGEIAAITAATISSAAVVEAARKAVGKIRAAVLAAGGAESPSAATRAVRAAHPPLGTGLLPADTRDARHERDH